MKGDFPHPDHVSSSQNSTLFLSPFHPLQHYMQDLLACPLTLHAYGGKKTKLFVADVESPSSLVYEKTKQKHHQGKLMVQTELLEPEVHR